MKPYEMEAEQKRQTVEKKLKEWGVSFTARFKGTTEKTRKYEYKGSQTYERDNFMIELHKKPHTEIFEYFQGSGHRAPAFRSYRNPNKNPEIKELGYDYVETEKYAKHPNGKWVFTVDGSQVKAWARIPRPLDFLYCVISDLSFEHYTMDEIQAELYGKDEPVSTIIRAKLDIEEQAKKLRKIFTNAQLEELQELCQDY